MNLKLIVTSGISFTTFLNLISASPLRLPAATSTTTPTNPPILPNHQLDAHEPETNIKPPSSIFSGISAQTLIDHYPDLLADLNLTLDPTELLCRNSTSDSHSGSDLGFGFGFELELPRSGAELSVSPTSSAYAYANPVLLSERNVMIDINAYGKRGDHGGYNQQRKPRFSIAFIVPTADGLESEWICTSKLGHGGDHEDEGEGGHGGGDKPATNANAKTAMRSTSVDANPSTSSSTRELSATLAVGV